jgi:hypothetical protein
MPLVDQAEDFDILFDIIGPREALFHRYSPLLNRDQPFTQFGVSNRFCDY